MDDLFDSSKPHFAAWHRVYDIDQRWTCFNPPGGVGVGSPLYYAAFCGFYDLTERLITRHPEQLNAAGGRVLAPLLAALSKGHFLVADLLYGHGAIVEVEDADNDTPLFAASAYGQVDTVRWLLDHGADVNASQSSKPLHLAAHNLHFDAVQLLLEHKADTNLLDKKGRTPLCEVLTRRFYPEETVVDIVRRLLEHGADPNIPHAIHSTPLHQASSYGGWLEVARLLLSYGAKVDEKDDMGRTPFQVATADGLDELTKLLLKHGAAPQP